MEEEKQEQNQAEKQKFNRTSFLIMAFVYMMLTATFVFYFKIGELTEAKEIVRRICDSVFIPSVIYLGIGGISYIGSKGGYDGLGYSFSNFGLHNIIPTFAKKKYENFYEYKTRKDEKGRKWLMEMLLIGAVGISVSIILLVIYYLV